VLVAYNTSMGKAIANTRTIRNHKSAMGVVCLVGLVVITRALRRAYAKTSSRIPANDSMPVSVLRSRNKSPE
jgi:hypothetical protein